MAEIGKRIRERREALGISQEELAFKLGYRNKSTIAKIETGINDIVQSKVLEFADVLETTVAYLMGWEENTNEDFKLSDLEKNIIRKFRTLNNGERAMFLRTIGIEEERKNETKMA